MQAVLEQHADDIAAVIVEPLVQCAGGMRMYDPVYLSLLRAACDRHDVHLIADEIAVGFGRTGTLFACEQAAISPDFLCLSKGLTGGYLPLSVVLTGEQVYEAFYAEYTAAARLPALAQLHRQCAGLRGGARDARDAHLHAGARAQPRSGRASGRTTGRALRRPSAWWPRSARPA